MDDMLRIEKLENGYEVEICDPKIMEENSKPRGNWRDPWKGYAFSTKEEVVAFVSEQLDNLKSPSKGKDEYATSFKQAVSEKD